MADGAGAYAAERPGFSIVEVLFIHISCSRQKILAVLHTSSAQRQCCAFFFSFLFLVQPAELETEMHIETNFGGRTILEFSRLNPNFRKNMNSAG